MAFLLIILLVTTGLTVAILSAYASSGSTAAESAIMTVLVISGGLSVVLIKLMYDDFQADRQRGGKPRLKITRKLVMPWVKRIATPVLVLGTVLAAIQVWRHWPEAERIEARTEHAQAVPAEPAAAQSAPQATPAPPQAAVVSQATADTSASEEELRACIEGWRSAWQERHIDAYLDSYAPSFAPSGGLSRQAWENQRRERIGKARNVSVRIEDIRFENLAAESAQVSFIQLYRASNLSDRTRKTLVFARAGDGWRITREDARPIN
jgi:ketosteroid isomerase-like protein